MAECINQATEDEIRLLAKVLFAADDTLSGRRHLPAPVPLLIKDFDTQKTDDHLMSRIEAEGSVPVDEDAGAKVRHG